MEITKLSSQGQVIIPQSFLEAHQWEVGQEFIVVDIGDGILLKSKKPFTTTQLDDVAGCLKYQGKPKTLEAINL